MTLKELRFIHNLTQEELAVITQVSQQHVSRIESGKARMSQKYADKLKGTFKLTLEQVWSMMKSGPGKESHGTRRGPYAGAGTKVQSPGPE